MSRLYSQCSVAFETIREFSARARESRISQGGSRVVLRIPDAQEHERQSAELQVGAPRPAKLQSQECLLHCYWAVLLALEQLLLRLVLLVLVAEEMAYAHERAGLHAVLNCAGSSVEGNLSNERINVRYFQKHLYYPLELLSCV